MRLEVNSFSAGVIKPRLFGRTDNDAYAMGLREAVNVFVVPEGGIIKRPGNTLIRAAEENTGNIRLEEFVDDDGDRSMLELGLDSSNVGYIKRQTESEPQTAVTTSVPWDSSTELYDMHCINEDGIMYVAHPATGLRIIQENGANVSVSTPTYYPIDPDDKVYRTADDDDDNAVIRTDNSGGDFQFFATDVGQYIILVDGSDIYYAEIIAVAETEYDDDEEPDFYYSKAVLGTVSQYPSGSDWASVAVDTTFDYIGIAPFNPYATTFLPGTVCFAGGRMYLSAFTSDKTKIYGSKVGEQYNFRLGPADNFGIELNITDMYGGEIRWLQGGKELLIGTDAGVLTVTAEGGLGATAIPIVVRQSAIGTSRIRPSVIGNTYIYPQKTLDGLRGFVYQLQQDSYSTPEYSMLASHLYDSPIRDITVINHPFTMYFVVLNDGSAITITYDQGAQVVAHTKQEFSGTLKSVAVYHGSTSDDIWMAIDNDGTVSLQKMESLYFEDDLSDGVFLESADSVTGADANLTSIGDDDPGYTITLDDASDFSDDDYVQFTDVEATDATLATFLESATFQLKSKDTNTFDLYDDDGITRIDGTYTLTSVTGTIKIVYKSYDFTGWDDETVEVIGDGVSLGTDTLTSGAITTLDDYYNKIMIGYSYSAYIRLLPFAPGEMLKRLVTLGVNVYKTTGLKIGEDTSTWSEMTFDDEMVSTTEPELFTGVRRKSFAGSYSNDNPVYIGTDEGYPMSLLCLYLNVNMEAE